MDCREAEEQLADRLSGETGADDALDAHLSACGTCREQARHAAEALAAVTREVVRERADASEPVRLDEVIAQATRGAPTSSSPVPAARRRPGLVALRRAAAVLLWVLAPLGALALAGARVEVLEDRVRLELAVSGLFDPPAPAGDEPVRAPTPPPPPSAPEIDAAVRLAVGESLEPTLREVVAWMAENEERRDDAMLRFAAHMEERQVHDARQLAFAVAETQRDLVETREVQGLLLRGLTDPPR